MKNEQTFPDVCVYGDFDPRDATWERLLRRTTDPILRRPLSAGDFSYSRATVPGTTRHACNVALGTPALTGLTSYSPIEQLRGYIFPTPNGPTIGTYHPEYIKKGKWNLARIVQLDLLKALEVARNGADVFFRDKAYVVSPSYAEVQRFIASWRAAGFPPLAFDIETPYSDEASDAEDMVFEDDASYTILMVSLAFEPFKAISIPWIPGLKELVIQVLEEAPTTLVWNAKFDVPRLVANGVTFGGEIVDGMLAWHWLEPALPMGLKYVSTFFCPDMHAWKLAMHKNFQWYNAADSDVLLRVYLGIKERLAEQGRWDTFMRHFVKFGKLLNKMTVRGVTIDHERRAEARSRFGERFSGVVARANERAPRSIKPVHPKRGYAKAPEDLTGLVQLIVELTPEEEARERQKVEREHVRAEKRKAIDRRKAERIAKRLAKEAARANKKPRGKKTPHGPVHAKQLKEA